MSTTATFSKKTAALIAAFLTIFAALTLNPIAAHAAANVSGVVSESVGSKPIGGATVSMISVLDTGAAVTTTTDTDGSYTLSAATSHADWIVTVSKTGYTTQSTAAFTAGGTAVTGKNVSLVTASAAATVSGIVSSQIADGTTTAINGATVVAYRDSSATDTVTTTTSTIDGVPGSYVLSLPAGNYTIGFTASGNVSAFLGGAATLSSGTTFAASGTITGKNAILTAQGSIGGTTNPINTVVTVYKTTGEQAADPVTSDGSGVYSVTGLTPGSYLVKFSKSTYVTEWWNDRASFGSATTVTVTAGNATGSISPTLDANGALTSVVSTGVTATVSGTANEGSTLTASNTAWGTSGADSNYQWFTASAATCDAGQADLPGAISSSYVVKAGDATKYICVKITGTKIGYLPSSTITSAAGLLAAHIFTTQPTPTITGTPTVGEVLTAVPGTWAPTQDYFNYQWKRGGSAITSNGTNSTYTVVSADVGYSITVDVTAVKNLYPSVTKTTAGTAAVGSLITNSVNPAITGTAAVGKLLTVTAGTWSPSDVTLTYQWKRGGTAITGATSSTYTLVAADLAYYITVDVTASKTYYTAKTVTTSSTAAVLDKLSSAPVPVITGNTTVGSVLTADPGTWAPATVTLAYQWYRNSIAISGATSSTYTLVAADDLTNISVTVTGTKAGYGEETKTSAAFQVGKQFVNHNAPTVAGNNWVGQTLRATIGLWDAAATLTHQWYRDGVTIVGAVNHTYKLTSADVGHKITIATTGIAAGYITTTSTSSPTAAILNGKPFTKAPTPTISGNSRVGSTLTAYAGGWSPAATKITYQWLKGGTVIVGANKSTYKLATADKGYLISVRVVATKSGFATTTKTSKLTTAVK